MLVATRTQRVNFGVGGVFLRRHLSELLALPTERSTPRALERFCNQLQCATVYKEKYLFKVCLVED